MNEGVDTSRFPSSTEVRSWAQSKKAGANLPNRGALPRFVILAWDSAHPDRPYIKSQAHHGTEAGYHDGCRCDQCSDVGRRAARERYYVHRDERDGALCDELAES